MGDEVARFDLISRVIAVVLVAFVAVPTKAEEAAGDEGPRYVDLAPTFVTNYGVSEDGHLSYVRTDVTLQVNSQVAENAAIYHTPALRNFLVMALSRQEEDGVATTEGRDILREEALETMRAYIKEEEGEPFIEDLLFTNFIVQQ